MCLSPPTSFMPAGYFDRCQFGSMYQLPPQGGYDEMALDYPWDPSLVFGHAPFYSQVPLGNHVAVPSVEANSLVLPNTTPSAPFFPVLHPSGSLRSIPQQSDTFEITCSRKRKPAKSEPASRKRTCHAGSDWDRRKEHLKYLRCQKNHTVEEIVLEMGLLYGFHAGESTYNSKFKSWAGFPRKNSAEDAAKTGDPRQRSSQSLTNIRLLAKPMTSKQVFFRLVRRRPINSPVNLHPNGDLATRLDYPHFHQETMLHEIEGLIKHFFGGSKTANWSIDATGDFVAPANIGLTRDPWALLSDRLACLAGLAARATCGSALGLLAHAVLNVGMNKDSACGPSFMVHFWKICLTLSQVRTNTRFMQGRLIFAYVFLLTLRYRFAMWFHARHAFVVILNSLLRTLEDRSTLKDFGPSVAIGYWKSFHVLQGLVGNENPVVLRMGTYCTKMCKSRFAMEPQLLEEKYQVLLDGTKPNRTGHAGSNSSGVTKGISVMRGLALAHDYVYALWHGGLQQNSLVARAEELRTDALELCRKRKKLRWGPATRALGFATEVLANHHKESMRSRDSNTLWNTKHECVCRYMDEAINTLGTGDVDCVLQAANLSRELAFWLKSTGRKGDSDSYVDNNYPGSRLSHKEEVKRKEKLVTKVRDVIRLPSFSFPSMPRGERARSRHARTRQKWTTLNGILVASMEMYSRIGGR